MYLPKHFEETEPAALRALLSAHPLATWVVVHDGQLLVNHIPFLLDTGRGAQGTLIGHVARANPVWRSLGAPSVLVFHGPQAYVSPNWYPSKREHGKAVPTWNYDVVHAHGTPRAVDDAAQVRAIVTRLTVTHEAGFAQPWQVADAPADYLDSMLGAIVGIEFPVQRWVGKCKASQNRSAADRQGVAEALLSSVQPEPERVAMAALVRGRPDA